MRFRRIRADWLTVMAGALWAVAGEAMAQGPSATARVPHAPAAARTLQVPLDSLPPSIRHGVRLVLEQPTLSIQGPAEVFRGRPAVYRWFLDHPDQAVATWRQLGARCTEITSQGGGRFRWTDSHGSELHWDTIVAGPQVRVWYAEGTVRPGPLLPAVPVHAVAVLRFMCGLDHSGHPLIRHQADVFLQTDSKTAALITRLLGSSGPRLAERGVAQMEMFFSALVWYLDHHPEWAEGLQLGGVFPQSRPDDRVTR
ncbi:MAG TPA: hypothetical protein VG013_13515 [Gemmataceae bacterium]|nr:hypothetical protein [Gemmataceae bacterium]